MYELTCPACGEMTHESFVRVGAVWICDSCGKQSVIREDNVHRVQSQGAGQTKILDDDPSSGEASSEPTAAGELAYGEGGSPERGDVPGLSGLSNLMRDRSPWPRENSGKGPGHASQSKTGPSHRPTSTQNNPTTGPPQGESQRMSGSDEAGADAATRSQAGHVQTPMSSASSPGGIDDDDLAQAEEDTAPPPTPEAVQRRITQRLDRIRARRRRVRTTLVLGAGLMLIAAVVGLTLYSTLTNQSVKSSPNEESSQVADSAEGGLTHATAIAETDDSADSGQPDHQAEVNRPEQGGASSKTDEGPEEPWPEGVEPDPDLEAISLSRYEWEKLDSPQPLPKSNKEPIRVSEARLVTNRDGQRLFKAMLVSGTFSMVDRATLTIWLINKRGLGWAQGKVPLSLISGLDTRTVIAPIPKSLQKRAARARARIQVERTLSDPDPIVDVEVQAFGTGQHTVLRVEANPPRNGPYQRMTFHVIAQSGSDSLRRTWRIDYPVSSPANQPVIFAVAVPAAPKRKGLVWSVHGIAVH